MNLIAVLPYCNKDLAIARRLLNWINELGGCHDHTCLLAADSGVKQEDRDELKKIATEGFAYAHTLLCRVAETDKYQRACNEMFLIASDQIMKAYKLPFLWLEPDCVPLKQGWLDDLAEGYSVAPRRYFGPIIKSEDAAYAPADIKSHVPAVSIYPNDARVDLGEFCRGDRCWDLASHEFRPPRTTDTRLIQQFWPGPDNLITFVAERTEEDPVNVRTLKSIRPEAVLFHQCKDDSLINVLRAKIIIPRDLSPDIRKLREQAK